MSQKIVPALWFTADGGKISPIVEYYKKIFGNDFEFEDITPLGETPSGNTEMCEVTIFGYTYSFMCTEKAHELFNDSFALIVNCDDQEEIDKYWNYFTKEGKEVQCGWCVDKYGLRFQVIPKNFGELMSGPNSWKIMMGQKKIVIDEYFK